MFNRCRSVALRGLFVVAAAGVWAMTTRPAADADEARLREKRTLRFPVAGSVTGAFERAYAVLVSTNALERVQQAYAAQLPEGETPEFEVMLASEGRYYYVNKDAERCDIRELWRETDTNSWFRTAFYVTGERTFGRFESLIYMDVRRGEGPEPGEVLHYTTDVRVWPHGAVVRVFLRYMPGVELYFRRKTAEMRGIVTSVFAGMMSPTG